MNRRRVGIQISVKIPRHSVPVKGKHGYSLKVKKLSKNTLFHLYAYCA